MKKAFIFAQTFLLSFVANALQPKGHSIEPSNSDRNVLAGDGTGTCIRSNRLAGDGTGTCLSSSRLAGNGTGTCIMERNLINGHEVSKATASELMVLEMIRNRMHTKNDAEKAMILEKIEKIYEDVDSQN